jgi:hypothetical protein
MTLRMHVRWNGDPVLRGAAGDTLPNTDRSSHDFTHHKQRTNAAVAVRFARGAVGIAVM